MLAKLLHPSCASNSNMPTPHQASNIKRATNLTLSAQVLADAKALGINISKACDAHLQELVRQEKEARWKLEHADYIKAYNAVVEEEALPLNSWKTF
jgi:antitoxin CcdA